MCWRLWRAGTNSVDRTSEDRQLLKLPDERVGLLFVFRVFDQVSYALILQSVDPVSPGRSLHTTLTAAP